MNLVHEIIAGLASDADTPFALAVEIAARYEDWVALQGLKPEPCNYLDWDGERLKKDLLVGELFRKCNLPTSVDKERAAVEAFWASERLCAQTNRRLDTYVNNEASCPEDEGVYQFITGVRKDIARALGCVPDTVDLRFSGGATYLDTGKLTTTPDKLSNTPAHYANMAGPLLDNIFWPTRWGRYVRAKGRSPVSVRGNIFFTVPKDGTKYRGCAKEASLAVSAQLGAAQALRRGLGRFGIDLKTGKSVHMRRAKRASETGEDSTVDLSNASDTVCRKIVELLLPREWYAFLNSLRAPLTRVKTVEGKLVWARLEKFSSMGNGFTFELETLIFCALARGVCREYGVDPDRVSVFGDDIILPTAAVRGLLACLPFFGFQVNGRKTFFEGPFRESCGGDYFNGLDVRARYLEEVPSEPHEWISLHNKLHSHSRLGVRAARRLKQYVPRHVWRLRGPASFQDDRLFHENDPTKWCVRDRKVADYHLVEYRVWEPIPEILPWHHWCPEVVLTSAILGMPSRGVTPRDGVSGYREGWAYHPGSSWLPA